MSLPTKARLPLCTYCDRPIWRTVMAQRADAGSGIRAGQIFPVWPAPESVYAVLATSTGYAPGVGFCPQCAPKVGEQALEGYGPVVGYDTAQSRYAAWYAPEKELFLRAWLRDALSYGGPEVDRIIAMWSKDCRG